MPPGFRETVHRLEALESVDRLMDPAPLGVVRATHAEYALLVHPK